MIRLTALWLVVAFILAYSWKDWYRGLCGLILLMAVLEHPDMPKSILGIPGLNPWNLLMFNVMLAWVAQFRREGYELDMPRHIALWLFAYLGVVIVGWVRLIPDTYWLEVYYREDGFAYFLNEYFINTVKWVLPALMLYHGCRTEERFRLALLCVLAVYLLLAVQVAKWIPPHLLLDAEALQHRSIRVLVGGMGYHRVNLSAMLAGASWAVLCTRVLFPITKRMWIPLAAMFIVYAQALTAGRAGYGAWVAVGFFLALIKWRRYLVLMPVGLALVVLLAPGVVGRATQGFTADSHDDSVRVREAEASRGRELNASSEVDAYTVTAGRSVAWPYILEGIQKQWAIGYGRQAMLRTGIAVYLYDTYGEIFPHPHNAYFEVLLDSGVLGFLVVIPFYLLMLKYSITLFRDRQSPSCMAIGGVSAALITALLVSAIGSQSFYPREGWVGMWCAMFLMLRVRQERLRRHAHGVDGAPAATTAPAPAWRPKVPAPALGRSAAAPAASVTLLPGARTTWRPRHAAAAAPPAARPRSTEPAAVAAAPAAPRTRPAGWSRLPRPAARPAAPGRLGWFGPAVVWDPLVWERA